jgi:hypothetical protein
MVPDDQALVPALACVACGRLIPRTAVSYRGKGSQKAQLNRALRAHRRKGLRDAQEAEAEA